MAEQTPSSFLGTGWSFPPTFMAGGAALATVSGHENVHKSLTLLLRTRCGERPTQESYGCDLDEALFEEADQALQNRITGLIRDAILRHEPRVVLLQLVAQISKTDPGLLHIRLDYAIPGTNSRFNMVFPFYLQEASSPT